MPKPNDTDPPAQASPEPRGGDAGAADFFASRAERADLEAFDQVTAPSEEDRLPTAPE